MAGSGVEPLVPGCESPGINRARHMSGVARPVGAVFPAAKLGGIPIGEGGLEPPFRREKRCKKPTRRAGPPYLLIYAPSGKGLDLLLGVSQEKENHLDIRL